MARSAIGLPPGLIRDNRVLRPRDATDVYAHPRAEFARLTRLGLLRRIATGYYALVPQTHAGRTDWQPEIEGAALAVAMADYPADEVALMGVSAARYHGALPRALAVAVVAVPKQRPQLKSELGRIIFVKRTVARLDVERIETELGAGWVTTVEQTLLDLAARQGRGAVAEADVARAIDALAVRADPEVLRSLAADQRKVAALRRIEPIFEATDA